MRQAQAAQHRSNQDIAPTQMGSQKIGACGGEESQRQQLWETHPKKRIMAGEITPVSPKKAAAIPVQLSVSNSYTVPKEATI